MDGETEHIADLLGRYETTALSGNEVKLDFTPAVNGRTFADVKVGDEAAAFEADGYTYTLSMPNRDTTVEISFTTVYKATLGQTITYAESVREEANAAVPKVQKAYEKALTAASTVYNEKSSTQEEIDKAWSDLLRVLQMLQFKPGDKKALASLVETAKSIDPEFYTTTTYEALQAALAEAEAVLADEDAMDDSITEAYQALSKALDGLVRRADMSTLAALLLKAQAVQENKDAYLDQGWDAFTAAYQAAQGLTEESSQKEINKAAQALTEAMANLRKIPNKSALQARVENLKAMDLSQYTSSSRRKLLNTLHDAETLLNNPNATQEKIDAMVEELDKDTKALETPSSSGSGNKGGSSGKGSGGRTSGEGTAVAVTTPAVVSGAASVAKTASVVSDTTVNFTLKRGSAYCFKMTVVNGSAATPGFTVGNGDVLKTQFAAKIGNDYYFRVYAVGTPGQSTGVYTTMPGEAAQKHCTITVG